MYMILINRIKNKTVSPERNSTLLVSIDKKISLVSNNERKKEETQFLLQQNSFIIHNHELH